MARPKKDPLTKPRVLTAEDLENNPELAEQGLKEGDTIQVPVDLTAETPEPAAPYPIYEKWRVDVGVTGDGERVNQYRFTAIKKLSDSVKIEDHVAAKLNAQSHNSRVRYYKAGDVTNGDEETVAA